MGTIAHGTVKFFLEKGYGFVVPDDEYAKCVGGEPFLHARAIPAGLPLPLEGSRIKFEYMSGGKGPKVTKVHVIGEVDKDFVARQRAERAKKSLKDNPPIGPVAATVKSVMGEFGFFENPSDPVEGKEIFFHKNQLPEGIEPKRGDIFVLTYCKVKKKDGSDGLKLVELQVEKKAAPKKEAPKKKKTTKVVARKSKKANGKAGAATTATA